VLKHLLNRRWSRTLHTATLVAVGVCMVAIPAIAVNANHIRAPYALPENSRFGSYLLR